MSARTKTTVGVKKTGLKLSIQTLEKLVGTLVVSVDSSQLGRREEENRKSLEARRRSTFEKAAEVLAVSPVRVRTRYR